MIKIISSSSIRRGGQIYAWEEDPRYNLPSAERLKYPTSFIVKVPAKACSRSVILRGHKVTWHLSGSKCFAFRSAVTRICNLSIPLVPPQQPGCWDSSPDHPAPHCAFLYATARRFENAHYAVLDLLKKKKKKIMEMLIKSFITWFKQHWQIRGCMCMCDGEGGGGGGVSSSLGGLKRCDWWQGTPWRWRPTAGTDMIQSGLRCSVASPLSSAICESALKTSGSFCRFQRPKRARSRH